ncbi:mitochondrial coenzyme A diphosphatase NUDT8 isoform X4 [Nycticebus coucang]|uniref:mitochondrial coenzyme A diphosphatase NUDT8 isoform X4 n=1 Tax=Nycticebus coucang TaxID=9470 RepID=UPI00234CAA0F|nr:mitochondrial coenzyme A diphosphatase NUDT8 isoform X4 [Nycticebus coucang]
MGRGFLEGSSPSPPRFRRVLRESLPFPASGPASSVSRLLATGHATGLPVGGGRAALPEVAGGGHGPSSCAARVGRGASAALLSARGPGAALHVAVQPLGREAQGGRQQRATVVPVLAGVGPLDLQSLRPNPEEVDEVFVLPLAHLLQTQNQGYTHFCRGGHFSYTLPVFLHGPHRVWGLTAVITEFTLQLLAPSTYQSVLATPELPRG